LPQAKDGEQSLHFSYKCSWSVLAGHQLHLTQ
jgi:hypothetical protein